MLNLKLEKVENGYVIQCSGHTVNGTMSTCIRLTKEEISTLIEERAKEWLAAETEREQLQVAQAQIGGAQNRYNAAIQAGKSVQEAIAAALQLPA